MSKQTVRLARRQAFALAAVLALVLGMLMIAPSAIAQETGEGGFSVSNAEFRWGLNKESLGRSHQPGAFNFISAGDLLDAPNPIRESSWKNTAGDVVIEKRGSSNDARTATWADTATDQSGNALSPSSSYSGLEMLFRNGKGQVDPVAGTATIQWSGTVSVIYYTGLVRMLISDPKLQVTKSGATVTATMEALESDQATQTVTGRIEPRSVTIADLTRNCVDLTGDNGFSVSPEFKGVKYEPDDVKKENPQNRTGSNWGAFPESFMDFVSDVGYAGFWYSTAEESSKKVPLPLSIGWDATKSDGLKEVCESSSTTTSKGLLGQVIDDTIEDVLRAAGTDAADTAAAWMDEAWKPLQPDAVKAAQADAAAADGAAAPNDGTVVSEVDAEFEGYYEEYYSAGAPITAGTVGATVGSIPASSSVSSVAPASAPAVNSADQATVQMAATSPLYGADVVYAQTSASSEAGSSSNQWQWWVGAALLAIAAMLFFQTVRRKD